MGMVQALMSTVMAIFFYALVIAAVWKLFQISTDLGEIKTLLANANRPAPAVKPVPAVVAPTAGPISLESAEALLREVAEESHALEQLK